MTPNRSVPLFAALLFASALAAQSNPPTAPAPLSEARSKALAWLATQQKDGVFTLKMRGREIQDPGLSALGLMALQSKSNVHGPASYLQNTGFVAPGFPCAGAWIGYALGRLTDDLPSFVVLPDPRGLPYNGAGNFSAGFLIFRMAATSSATSPAEVR